MGWIAPRNHEAAVNYARPMPAFQGHPGAPSITRLEFDRRVVERCMDIWCSGCKAIREKYAGHVMFARVLGGELSVAS